MFTFLFAAQDPGAVQTVAPVIRAVRALPEAPKCHLVISSLSDARAVEAIETSCNVLLAESRLSYRTIIEDVRPHVLITGSSAPNAKSPFTPEQSLHSLCRECGIPSILILDFWGNYSERFSDFGGELNPKYLPTWICALDELSKKMLLAAGIENDRIIVTHNPYYDSIVAECQDLPSPVRRNRLKVLFISQPHAERGRKMSLGYDQFTNFAALMEGLSVWNTALEKEVFIWTHPMEDQATWSRLIEAGGFPHAVEISNERDRLFVNQIDLVCSAFSTSIYRFLYYGVPAISLQVGLKQKDQLITNELGLTVPIYDREVLHKVFCELDVGAWKKRVVMRKKDLTNQGIFFSRGNATKKVLQLLHNIVAGNGGLH